MKMRWHMSIKEMTPKRSIITLECGIENQGNHLSNLWEQMTEQRQ